MGRLSGLGMVLVGVALWAASIATVAATPFAVGVVAAADGGALIGRGVAEATRASDEGVADPAKEQTGKKEAKEQTETKEAKEQAGAREAEQQASGTQPTPAGASRSSPALMECSYEISCGGVFKYKVTGSADVVKAAMGDSTVKIAAVVGAAGFGIYKLLSCMQNTPQFIQDLVGKVASSAITKVGNGSLEFEVAVFGESNVQESLDRYKKGDALKKVQDAFARHCPPELRMHVAEVKLIQHKPLAATAGEARAIIEESKKAIKNTHDFSKDEISFSKNPIITKPAKVIPIPDHDPANFDITSVMDEIKEVADGQREREYARSLIRKAQALLSSSHLVEADREFRKAIRAYMDATCMPKHEQRDGIEEAEQGLLDCSGALVPK